MKVNSIQNQPYQAYKNNTKSNKTLFKGTLAINCWDAIARGGFASSFMVQDVLGTCLPRTYQSLNRNKDITHKKNYKAAAETALREFITGPSMVAIPMFVLAGANKLSGTTNSVPLENIAPFSDEMKKILENMPINPANAKNNPIDYAAKAKKRFYEQVFSMALGESGENGASDVARELARDLREYDKAPKRNFFQQLFNKDIIRDGKKVRAKDQIFNSIVTKYTDAKKGLVETYDCLLTTNMNGALKKPNKISSLIKDFSNFGNDVEKTMVKHSKDGYLPKANIDFSSFMETFKQKRTGSKYLTNILMVAATALFMTQIPKLYMINKTNPETDAFRNESGEVVRADK